MKDPPPFQFVSEPWEEKREKDGAAPASFQRGQGESVSPMACSCCRCHLVIILKKPSAPAAPFLSVGSWQHPGCVILHPVLPPVSGGPIRFEPEPHTKAGTKGEGSKSLE